MPRGVDYRIPLADVLRAADDHGRRGWSLRSIARLHWRRWGYASEGSALEGLRGALRTIDAPVRGRVEQVVLVSTLHGNASRAAHRPGHPDHRRYLEHRRAMRKSRARP